MKNLILLFALSFIGMSLGQGVVTSMKSNYGLISDTATNTGTAYVELAITKTWSKISVQAVVTKISGTVAGNVLLQASLDGVNYKDISTDTLSNSDQTTNTKIWIVEGSPYAYYRLLLTGSGTMAATIKGSLFTSGAASSKHTVTNLKSQYDLTSDTVTNAATKYLTLSIKNPYQNLVIQPVVTKISGTAGGTITLEVSNDGTNYVTISSSYSNYQTLSVANQTTNTRLFLVTGSPYYYYRLKYVGSGTMACKFLGLVLPTIDDLR